MSEIIGYVNLALAFVVLVFRSFVILLKCPVRVYQTLSALFVPISMSIYVFFQDRNNLIVLGIVLLGYFLFGHVGIDQTSTIIETFNIAYECVIANVAEIMYRVLGFNLRAAYEFLSDFINNATVKILLNASIAYQDFLDPLKCVVNDGDVSAVLLMPHIIWTKFFSFAIWSLSREPLEVRREPFNEFGSSAYGYEHPRGSTRSLKFQYPFGRAAQGAANANPTDAEFIANDFLALFGVLVDDIGTFSTVVIRDIRQPGSQFFPSFYRGVSDEQNYWRYTADIVTRVVEIVTLTPLWTRNSLNRQLERTEFVKYVATNMRNIADIFSTGSLILNDILTTRRPLISGGQTCGSTGSLEELFQGVPIIDLILAGENFDNVLIFKSSLKFCELQRLTTITVTVQMTTIDLTCTGIATGSLVSGCQKWTGNTGIPTANRRIDYWDLIFVRAENLVNSLIGFDLIGTTHPLDGLRLTITNLRKFLTFLADFVTFSPLYVFNGLAQSATCSVEVVFKQWLFTDLGELVISAINLVLGLDCTDYIMPDTEDGNVIYCILVALSVRIGGFFQDVVCILDDVTSIPGFPGQDIDFSFCRRKRSMSASEHLNKRDLTYTEGTYMWSMYYASQTRAAGAALDRCFIADDSAFQACDAECASYSCVGAALDCMYGELPESNIWTYAIGPKGQHSYARSIAAVSTIAMDLLRGCEDGFAVKAASSISATISLVRDFGLRYFVFTQDYMDKYASCMEAHRRNVHGGMDTNAADYEYLVCVGAEEGQAPANTTEEGAVDFHTPQDAWVSSLRRQGITGESSRCGYLLHTHGVLYDDMNVAGGLGSDHVSYRICSMSHAIWARSSQVGGNRRALGDYLGASTMFSAVTESTSNLQMNRFPDVRDMLPRSFPHSYIGSGTSGREPSLLKGFSDTVRGNSTANPEYEHFFRGVGVAYAFFNHLADVYDMAASNKYGPEEMDRRSAQMLQKVVRVAGLDASVLRAPAKKLQDDILQIPASANKIQSLYRAMGESLYWIDQLGESPVDIEAYVDLSRTSSGPNQKIYMGIRRVEKGMGVVAGNPGFPGDLDEFTRVDLDVLQSALYMDVHHRHSRLEKIRDAQQASTGLEAIGRLRETLQHRVAGDSLQRYIGDATYTTSKILLRTLWTIVNNRLRVESLGVTQAAHVAIDAITSGESDELGRWITGDAGYVVGAGYVSKEAYEKYMDMEQDQRRAFMRGYMWSSEHQDLHELYFASVREDAIDRIEGLVKNLPMIEGKTQAQKFKEKMKRDLRSASFSRRSRFLIKHGLHDDEFLHHVAGPNWVHYEAAKGANDTVSRMRFSLMASANSNEFWVEAWDDLLEMLGATPLLLSDTLDSSEDTADDLWDFLIDNIVDVATEQYDTLFAVGKCTGPQAYRLGGTEVYRLGCFPYIPERLLEWIEPFPSASLPLNPSNGLLNAFSGPGYLEWPDEMLALGGDCANKLDPNLFPPPSVSFFSDPFGFPGSITLSDACPMNNGPLCPVCDYCPRTWRSARDFGFTSGFDNIKVWDSSMRFVLKNALDQTGGYLFVIIAYVLFNFGAVVPMTGGTVSILIVAAMMYGDMFVLQRPERFVYTFLGLTSLRLVSAGLSYGSFAFYVYSMFFPYALSRAPPPFVSSIVNTVSDVLLPGPLFLRLFDLIESLPFLSTLETLPLIGPLFNVADYAPLRASLLEFISRNPTLPEVFYSVTSLRNFLDLLLLSIPYLFLIYVVFIVFVEIVGCLVDVLIGIFDFYIRFRDFFYRVRVRRLERVVADSRDQLDDLSLSVADLKTRLDQKDEDVEVLETAIVDTSKELRKRRRDI